MKSTYTGLAYAANSALPAQLRTAGLTFDIERIVRGRPYRDDQAVTEVIKSDGQLSKLQQLGDELCQARTGQEVAVEVIRQNAEQAGLAVIGPMVIGEVPPGLQLFLLWKDMSFEVEVWRVRTFAYLRIDGCKMAISPHLVVDAIVAYINYQDRLRSLEPILLEG